MSKLQIVLILSMLYMGSACSRYTDDQEAELKRGKEVYLAHCLSCHGGNGRGLEGIYPGLIRKAITQDYTARAKYLLDNGSTNGNGMLPIHITEKEKTEVINYIQNSWGNTAVFQTIQNSTQLSTN